MIDLAPWHDFWLFTGGAAATLAGLIFVALTLRMREILASRHAITLARGAFYYFITILGMTAAMLAPWPDDRSLGSVVVIGGAINLFQSVGSLVRLRKAPRAERDALRGVPVVWRLFAPILARLLVLLAGVDILRDDPRGAGVLAVAAAMLLLVAASNAWDLVTALRADDAE